MTLTVRTRSETWFDRVRKNVKEHELFKTKLSDGWVSVNDRWPEEGQRVQIKLEGVWQFDEARFFKGAFYATRIPRMDNQSTDWMYEIKLMQNMNRDQWPSHWRTHPDPSDE